MDATPVFNHAKKTVDAIVCLRDAGHHVAAVMLTYAAIDQMSWLCIPGEDSSAKDFKAWVKRYMLTNGNLDNSEDDLWAARNGLLHMGTAESRDHKCTNTKKAVAKNKIYYTVGNAVCPNNLGHDVVVLSLEKLVGAYLAGVLWFMEDLRGNQHQLSVALDKVGRMLTSRGL